MAGPTTPATNTQVYEFDNRPFHGDGANYMAHGAKLRTVESDIKGSWNGQESIAIPGVKQHVTMNAVWENTADHLMYFSVYQNGVGPVALTNANCPTRLVQIQHGDNAYENGDLFNIGDQSHGLILCRDSNDWKFRWNRAHAAEISLCRLGPADTSVRWEVQYTSDSLTPMFGVGTALLHMPIEQITNIGLKQTGSGFVTHTNLFARWW